MSRRKLQGIGMALALMAGIGAGVGVGFGVAPRERTVYTGRVITHTITQIHRELQPQTTCYPNKIIHTYLDTTGAGDGNDYAVLVCSNGSTIMHRVP